MSHSEPSDNAAPLVAVNDNAELSAEERLSIDLESFQNRMAREAGELAERIDEPIEIIRSLMIGGAVLAARHMSQPSQSQHAELSDLMASIELASKGLLRGSVKKRKTVAKPKKIEPNGGGRSIFRR